MARVCKVGIEGDLYEMFIAVYTSETAQHWTTLKELKQLPITVATNTRMRKLRESQGPGGVFLKPSATIDNDHCHQL